MTRLWPVRDVHEGDAPALTLLLNELITIGGTTALETPFTAERLADTFLTGPDVLCCVVALDPDDNNPLGFQTVIRDARLPPHWGDIGTFARPGVNRRGVGSALFATTRARARVLGLVALNATIRADNSGGLVFYTKQGFEDYDIETGVPLQSGPPVDRIKKRFSL